MRIKYTGFLLSDATAQLKRFPLPEPPSDEEMAAELAGIERLRKALKVFHSRCQHVPTGSSAGECDAVRKGYRLCKRKRLEEALELVNESPERLRREQKA